MSSVMTTVHASSSGISFFTFSCHDHFIKYVLLKKCMNKPIIIGACLKGWQTFWPDNTWQICAKCRARFANPYWTVSFSNSLSKIQTMKPQNTELELITCAPCHLNVRSVQKVGRHVKVFIMCMKLEKNTTSISVIMLENTFWMKNGYYSIKSLQ